MSEEDIRTIVIDNGTSVCKVGLSGDEIPHSVFPSVIGRPKLNLYDIFYGKFKEKETELLRKYVELAPREDFQDILDAIDQFVYFDSRKK